MRQKGCFICSVEEYERTYFLRFLIADTIEQYKQGLEYWYPSREWKLSDHKAWFHLTELYKGISSRLENFVDSLNDSCKIIFKKERETEYGSLYVCKNSSKISLDKLQQTIYEGVHEIVLDTLENDISDENDFVTELRSHMYQKKCILTFNDSENTGESEEKEQTCNDKLIYKPINFDIDDSIKNFNVICNEYIEDPWNTEYPIVWSSTALKDLIKYCQYIGIISQYDKHFFKNDVEPTDYWMVDDTLNIRSKAVSCKISKYDIQYLFMLLGDIPNIIFNSLENNNSYYELSLELNDYYESPLKNTDGIPVGLVSVLPHGKLFGHAYIDSHTYLPITKPLKAQMERENESALPLTTKQSSNDLKYGIYVHVLTNIITEHVKCISTICTDGVAFLLPEVNRLHSVKVETQKSADELQALFDKRFIMEPSPYEKDISKMLEEAYRYKHRTLEKSSEVYREVISNAADGEEEFIIKDTSAMTVRTALEYLLKRFKLIPSTTWAPSSIVLEELTKYIQNLSSYSTFSSLTCQKNQLSILLADIVPKKRFVSGQMFQMQPPTPAIVYNAIQELLKVYVKKTNTEPVSVHLPPIPKSTKTKTLPYKDIRSDIEINKVIPSPWSISSIDKQFENFKKLDL